MVKKVSPKKKTTTVVSSEHDGQNIWRQRLIAGGLVLAALLIPTIFLVSQIISLRSTSSSKYNLDLPDLSRSVADLGGAHIGPGSTHPPYNSNPPTSGPHYPNPAKYGFYTTNLPDETVLHNLEHGGIWISYRHGDDSKVILQLRDIAHEFPDYVIVTYRPDDDARIVVAAWGRLLKMNSMDSVEIYNFILRYHLRGPENK